LLTNQPCYLKIQHCSFLLMHFLFQLTSLPLL
jgi:hypothetical protein